MFVSLSLSFSFCLSVSLVMVCSLSRPNLCLKPSSLGASSLMNMCFCCVYIWTASKCSVFYLILLFLSTLTPADTFVRLYWSEEVFQPIKTRHSAVTAVPFCWRIQLFYWVQQVYIMIYSANTPCRITNCTPNHLQKVDLILFLSYWKRPFSVRHCKYQILKSAWKAELFIGLKMIEKWRSILCPTVCCSFFHFPRHLWEAKPVWIQMDTNLPSIMHLSLRYS